MKINYLVDNWGKLKFLGSSTSPKYYFDYLKKKRIDVRINDSDDYYDIVHVHTITPWQIKKAIHYKNKGAKLVHTVHSEVYTNKNNSIGIRFLEERYYNWCFKKFDYLLAVSDFVKKNLTRKGFNNVTTCYNTIDTKLFQKDNKLRSEFRKELGINDDEILVLNVAQLTPRKGVYDFIKIANNNPKVKFLWIGGTPLSILSKDYFKIKKLTKKKYNNLTFYGYINNIVKAYSAADILLTPSYNETFGLTIIEAVSCGLPVIARNLTVYKELFNNKILYAENNDDFSKRINQLTNKNNRAKQIKKSQSLKKKYDIKKQGDELIKFYKSILAKK